jgi:hypothetical protein
MFQVLPLACTPTISIDTALATTQITDFA